MTLFLSLYSIVTTLYESKDTPFLSTLPIRPSSVFFAKLAMTYVSAIKLSSLVIAPLLLTSVVVYNVVSGSIFYGIYPLILLILLAPLLPLFIVTVFSMPIVWLGSYFKGRPTLKSILTVCFYVVLMCAYMVLVYYMNTTGFGQEGEVELSGSMLSSLATLSYVLYPDKVLVELCLGISVARNLGISAAIFVAMLALILGLSMLFYKRIAHRHSEGITVSEVKSTALKQSNMVVSLIRKDFTGIMRLSSLAMSSLANLILAPIFIVLMYFVTEFKEMGEMTAEADAFMYDMMGIGFVLMYAMIFLGGANMLASLAYTREGKSYFASKALPINPKDSIKAKLLISIIAPAIIMVPIMLISILLYKIDIASTLFIAIDTLMTVTGVCSMSILFDMKKGNQHWEAFADMNAGARTNTYQLISAVVSIIPAVVMFALGIILSVCANTLGETLIKVIYFAIGTLLSAVIMAVGLMLLHTLGERWYVLIGENKPNYKKVKAKGFGAARLMK